MGNLTTAIGYGKAKQEEKRQKGMNAIMNIIKVGKTAFDIGTGNWLGAIGNWINVPVKDSRGALDLFNKWKNNRSNNVSIPENWEGTNWTDIHNRT